MVWDRTGGEVERVINAMDSKAGKFDYYNRIYMRRRNNLLREIVIRGCAEFFNYCPVPKHYAGKKVMSREEANEKIGELIESGKPFVVSRFGNIELLNLTYYYMKNILEMDGSTLLSRPHHITKTTLDTRYLEARQKLMHNAGFFPVDDEHVSRFGELCLGIIGDIDILGTWGEYLEEFFAAHVMNNTLLTNLYYLEPWFSKNPWSQYLKGKRVLLIHPFEKTIISQYKKRDSIFADKRVLPEFELKTIKAVQTIAGNRDERFADWFEALDYMYERALQINFDIAIIGCGAYGMPLAVKLKRAGKQAIHLGGATQLLFGIKGARWEQPGYPTKIARYFNSSWVRPQERDEINNWESIEKGCYW